MKEIMTPEQAANYLQVARETIYRYIREGKLGASRLGRAYRIPKPNLDLLLWENRTQADIPVRQFSREDVSAFLEADRLDDESRHISQGVLD